MTAIPTEAAPEPTETNETAGGSSSGTPKQDNGSQGNREARYRVERNEARQERDALAQRIERLQTQELHRLAGELLAQPEDIGLSGKDLADFLTPEGWLDREAVVEVAAEVVEARPGLAKNPKVYAVDMTQGMGGGTSPKAPEWGDLFK